MRALTLLLLLAAPLAAQPLALDTRPDASGVSEPEPVGSAPAEVPKNTILLEAGGLSVAGAVRYERRLTPRLVGTVGLGHYGLDPDDIMVTWVPVGISMVQPVAGRFHVDLGVGLVAGRSRHQEDSYSAQILGVGYSEEAQVRYAVYPHPLPTAGVRYEGARLHARLGATAFFMRSAPIAGQEQRWIALPWPALSAGYRF